MILTPLLYSMEEKPTANAELEAIIRRVEQVAIQEKIGSFAGWWLKQKNKSPFSVLKIDPYASLEVIHDSLSKIPDTEKTEILSARDTLQQHNLLQIRAD